MPASFFPAPEAQEIAAELIAEYHRHLIEHGVDVVCIFRDDTPKSNGREVWGTARKVSGMNAFFLRSNFRGYFVNTNPEPHEIVNYNEPLFLITISLPIWNDLNEHGRRALVDHELMHCWAEEDDSGEVQLKIIGHDFEGFNKEIERHGLWRSSAQTLAYHMNKQMTLFDSVERAMKTGGVISIHTEENHVVAPVGSDAA
jgi:hypothetical protein